MRQITSFAIGLVLGASGVLIFLQESGQLAIAAEPVVSRQSVVTPPVLRQPETGNRTTTSSLTIPVLGIRATDLRDNFAEIRGGGTRMHGAIDILAPRGTPVVSACDGRVRKIFTSNAGGLTVYVTDPSEQQIYYYAHLDRYAPGLREGMEVKRGTILGYVGTSGNAPPGTPHLHFAIENLPPTKEWWKGSPVNPYPLLVRGITME